MRCYRCLNSLARHYGVGFTQLLCRANGRLAMIAVIAAVSAELASGKFCSTSAGACSITSLFAAVHQADHRAECPAGKGVVSQLKLEPTLITLTFLLISVATFIPFSQNVDPEEKEGIFTPYAEVVNGRAASKTLKAPLCFCAQSTQALRQDGVDAVLGFASLLLIEAVRGTALFGQ